MSRTTKSRKRRATRSHSTPARKNTTLSPSSLLPADGLGTYGDDVFFGWGNASATQTSVGHCDPQDASAEKLGFSTEAEFLRARDVLIGAGYKSAEISKLFKGKAVSSPGAADLLELLAMTGGGSPLETFVRLFFLNVEVPVEDAQRALGSTKIDSWTRAQVLKQNDGVVVPTIRLLPYDGLLVAVESLETVQNGRSDLVSGVTPSRIALTKLMIHRPSKRMLDLHTGCGVLALIASGFCERVHAIDANPRAVMFARFNAQLNDCSNVSVHRGNFFEPVRRMSFDLIVSGASSIISPDMENGHRGVRECGGATVERIIREAPRFLEQGGFCQTIRGWGHCRDRNWHEDVSRWFDGTGCDAWVMRRLTQTPTAYAKALCSTLHNAENANDRFARWMDFYRREAIEAISTGLITMRRQSEAKHWVRIDEWASRLGDGAGTDVLEGFALQDYLEDACDDAKLFQTRFRVSSRVRLDQKCEPSAGEWRCVGARVELVGGLSRSWTADVRLVKLLRLCDGTCRLGDVLKELSESLPTDVGSISTDFVRGVRRLIAAGVLLPEIDESGDCKCGPELTKSKVMVLMRGFPSCGKSKAARKLAKSGGVVFEFDEYFYTQVGEDSSKYDWSSDLLPKAREWNLDRILPAIDSGVSPIIIDSDNEPGRFTKKYVAHAIDRGYQIQFKEPDSTWWRAIRVLLRDKHANAEGLRAWAHALTQMSKTTHRVSVQEMLRRIEKWEETSTERIMATTSTGKPASRNGD
jgi:SAM-dependent methyltransferase